QARHHNIQQNQIRRVVVSNAQCFVTVEGYPGMVIRPQYAVQDIQVFGHVIHQQDGVAMVRRMISRMVRHSSPPVVSDPSIRCCCRKPWSYTYRSTASWSAAASSACPPCSIVGLVAANCSPAAPSSSASSCCNTCKPLLTASGTGTSERLLTSAAASAG